MPAPIALIGAGRMGRGLAVVFAYCRPRRGVDRFQAREASAFAVSPSRHAPRSPAPWPCWPSRPVRETDAAAIAERVRIVPEAEAADALPGAAFIFEGVPEVLEQKRAVFALASRLAGPEPIIASTTSTILVDDLSGAVEHPGRFSTRTGSIALPHAVGRALGRQGDPAGRDPVGSAAARRDRQGSGALCGDTGYIVPRIQALAMNEAARMVEEGVASPRISTRPSNTASGCASPCWVCSNSSTGAAVTSVLRQPISDQGAEQRTLCRAGDRRAQHARRPIGMKTGRASSTTTRSIWRVIARNGCRLRHTARGLALRGRRFSDRRRVIRSVAVFQGGDDAATAIASGRNFDIDPEEWEARVDLAACYRLVAHYGMDDIVYTHVSARVPGSDDHFLINCFGTMFEEITARRWRASTSTAR
jgi:hypothetical protein